MDMSNAQGVIDVRLQLAQEKRLDGAACAVQREQSAKTCRFRDGLGADARSMSRTG